MKIKWSKRHTHDQLNVDGHTRQIQMPEMAIHIQWNLRKNHMITHFIWTYVPY